jgi:hypothetical protein
MDLIDLETRMTGAMTIVSGLNFILCRVGNPDCGKAMAPSSEGIVRALSSRAFIHFKGFEERYDEGSAGAMGCFPHVSF